MHFTTIQELIKVLIRGGDGFGESWLKYSELEVTIIISLSPFHKILRECNIVTINLIEVKKGKIVKTRKMYILRFYLVQVLSTLHDLHP